jgi:hypothetical protein
MRGRPVNLFLDTPASPPYDGSCAVIHDFLRRSLDDLGLDVAEHDVRPRPRRLAPLEQARLVAATRNRSQSAPQFLRGPMLVRSWDRRTGTIVSDYGHRILPEESAKMLDAVLGQRPSAFAGRALKAIESPMSEMFREGVLTLSAGPSDMIRLPRTA